MNSFYKSTTGLIARSTRQINYTPTASFHISPYARESVIDKAKNIADSVNKQVGKKASDAIEGAEQATETATKKAQGLKEQAFQSADHINKTVGQKASNAVEGAESATEAASQKAKDLKNSVNGKRASQAAEEVKDEAKLKTKKAAHYADQTKDKAASYAKDTKNKAAGATNEAKDKAKQAVN